MQQPARPRPILDALAAGPTFSFEFFPPRDDASEAQLWQAIEQLAELHPAFVSITYGAGGSTREGSTRITHRIATETSLVPLAHLTAVGHSTDELRAILRTLEDGGVHDILAVRGDPPGDPEGEWIKHPQGVEYAADLVRLVHEVSDFTVGVAAFPHKHPRSVDIDSDARRFVEKCEAGASFAITQMFFEADDYLRLRDRVVALGCHIPIIAGIMPVLSTGTIERAPKLSGAPFPPALAAEFGALGPDKAGVRALGIQRATELSERLLREGAPGIHFITMNRAKASREICANLGITDQVGAAQPS